MKVFKNLLMVVVSIVFALSLLEGVGFIINKTKKRDVKERYRDAGFIIPDKVLGYKPAPDGNFRDAFFYNGEMIYNVSYATDRYSRRITPVGESGGGKRFALFFGGSHIFGEGVADDETLPYFFARDLEGFLPYNYGFMGYGPQQALMRLYLTPIRQEIPEQDGYAFFFYIGHWQVFRAIGEMGVINGWGDSLPCLTINDKNELVCRGTFKSARPFLYRTYNILGRSQFLKAFGITVPPFLTTAHYTLTTRIIKSVQERYKALFNNENFYVIIAPSTHPSVLAASVAIIPFLEKEGVKYLDYSTLIDFSEEKYNLKGDGHPTPLANEIIAERLAADVERIEKNERYPADHQ